MFKDSKCIALLRAQAQYSTLMFKDSILSSLQVIKNKYFWKHTSSNMKLHGGTWWMKGINHKTFTKKKQILLQVKTLFSHMVLTPVEVTLKQR